MPNFAYTARDTTGRTHRGTVDSDSADGAVRGLRQRGWMIIDVRRSTNADNSVWSSLTAWDPMSLLPVRSVDVEISLQQIATMLRGGLTLLAALQTVAKQAERPAMRQVWIDVTTSVQEGASLAEALRKHSCFEPIVVQLVRVGEQTGHLDDVLRQAAQSLESSRKLTGSVMAALAYPTLVVVAAIGVTVYMLAFLIPKLKVFLAALGKKLPPMTQFLVDLSTFMQIHGVSILATAALAIGALVAAYFWPPGRMTIDYLLLRIPVIGHLLQLSGTVVFARGMKILLTSGITLIESLATVEGLISNRFLAARVASARETVLRGGSFTEGMSEGFGFPPLVPAMLSVGESAGTLDIVSDEIARFHDEQLQSTLQQLSAILEPAITVVIGGIVGFVYIAFFMALFAASG